MERLISIFLIVFLWFSWATAAPAMGGEDRIGLGWQPVDEAVSYRIFYAPVDSGDPALVFEADAEATSLDLPVEEATRYWACAVAVDAAGHQSPECSAEVYGWPAPRIESVVALEAVYDAASGRNQITLDVAGFNFRELGSILVDDPSVEVVARQWHSTRSQTLTLSVDSSVTSLSKLRLRAYNKDESEPQCDLSTGGGCVFGQMRIDVTLSSVTGGIFSTATDPYTSSGRLFDQSVYAIPAEGESIDRFVESFLSGSVGLTALDLLPGGDLLFGVDASKTVSNQGNLIQVRRDTIYRLDDSGTIEPFLDFGDAGFPLSDFSALKALDDGSVLFVPSTTQWVSFAGGLTRVKSAIVYRFDPQNASLAEVFDAGRLGLAAIDGIDVLPDNRIAISPIGSPYVTTAAGLTRLRDANIYAVDDADNFELRFRGSSFGVSDLDAFSLGTHVEVDVAEYIEPPPPPPRSVLIVSTATTHYAGTKRLFHSRAYAAATDSNDVEDYGASFVTGSVGLDAVDVQLDGTVIFSVAQTGYVSHAGGTTQLFDSNLYRRDAEGTITEFLRWTDFGSSPGDVDAVDLLDDGSVVFSTESNRTVVFGGEQLTLRGSSAYRFDPTNGSIELFFDGSQIGIPDLDAIQVLDDRTVFSTATSPWVGTSSGTVRLWSSSLYALDPETGALEVWFDGSDRGLSNLDAMSLRDPETDDGF